MVTGQLYVDLDFVPGAPPARIDWRSSIPELRAVSSGIAAITDTVADIAEKLDRLPLEHTVQELRPAIRDGNHLINRLDSDVAPAAVSALKGATRKLPAQRRQRL